MLSGIAIYIYSSYGTVTKKLLLQIFVVTLGLIVVTVVLKLCKQIKGYILTVGSD